jgi:hypothetical protein
MIKYAQEYANHPNMIGCTVKMLNGFECYSSTLFPIKDARGGINSNDTAEISEHNPRIPQYDRSLPLNTTAIDIAIRRLRQFRFVGLFDQFNTSLHLLHRVMVGYKSKPSVVELFPQRTTSSDLATLISSHITVHDPYDSILYNEARKLFAQQLKECGMVELMKNV